MNNCHSHMSSELIYKFFKMRKENFPIKKSPQKTKEELLHSRLYSMFIGKVLTFSTFTILFLPHKIHSITSHMYMNTCMKSLVLLSHCEMICELNCGFFSYFCVPSFKNKMKNLLMCCKLVLFKKPQ